MKFFTILPLLILTETIRGQSEVRTRVRGSRRFSIASPGLQPALQRRGSRRSNIVGKSLQQSEDTINHASEQTFRDPTKNLSEIGENRSSRTRAPALLRRGRSRNFSARRTSANISAKTTKANELEYETKAENNQIQEEVKTESKTRLRRPIKKLKPLTTSTAASQTTLTNEITETSTILPNENSNKKFDNNSERTTENIFASLTQGKLGGMNLFINKNVEILDDKNKDQMEDDVETPLSIKNKFPPLSKLKLRPIPAKTGRRKMIKKLIPNKIEFHQEENVIKENKDEKKLQKEENNEVLHRFSPRQKTIVQPRLRGSRLNQNVTPNFLRETISATSETNFEAASQSSRRSKKGRGQGIILRGRRLTARQRLAAQQQGEITTNQENFEILVTESTASPRVGTRGRQRLAANRLRPSESVRVNRKNKISNNFVSRSKPSNKLSTKTRPINELDIASINVDEADEISKPLQQVAFNTIGNRKRPSAVKAKINTFPFQQVSTFKPFINSFKPKQISSTNRHRQVDSISRPQPVDNTEQNLSSISRPQQVEFLQRSTQNDPKFPLEVEENQFNQRSRQARLRKKLTRG